MNEKRVTEILIAAIFVVVLIILIILLTSQSIVGKSVSQNSNPQIINSYNTYQTSQPTTTQYSKPTYYSTKYSTPISYSAKYPRYYKVYDARDYQKDKYLRYKTYGEKRQAHGVFGNDIDNYIVYVKNNDYKGGYFTVRFYFEDYYGEPRYESVTHYIPAHQERAFIYKDIYADKHKYYRRDYEIISHTKIPNRDYVKNPNIRYINQPIRIHY